MYKIYINETPLLLTTIEEAKKFGAPSDKILILRYAGKKKFLLNVVNQLENSQRFDRVVVFHKDVEELWATFRRIFKIVEAAGGAVFNADNQLLMIYRRHCWDLPKGKIDAGESPDEAGLREVTEETGISRLQLGPHLTDTWHTYQEKGKRILKKTYWYIMQTDQSELIPQTEEDIEKAEWRSLQNFLAAPPGRVYNSILEVMQLAGEQLPEHQTKA